MSKKITREMTRSPYPPMPGNHDWRKEPWVINDLSELAVYLGLHIACAIRASGDNPQDEEDAIVWTLLRPDITQTVLKSDDAREVVRYRVAHAIAQAIEKVTRSYAAQVQARRAGGAS